MVMADFPGQKDGEQVYLVLRRHFSSMEKGLLVAVLSLILLAWPVIIWPGLWTFIILVIGIVICLIEIFYTWLRWYYGVYIITDQRIRQQVQKGLFHKSTIDIYLNKVQNISYNISGLLGSIGGYGTIILRTVAGDMVMTSIGHCESVYSEISKLIQIANSDNTNNNSTNDNDG